MAINWGKYGEKEIKAENQEFEQTRGGGSGDFMRWQDGENIIRVLPPSEGDNGPFALIYEHKYQNERMKFPARFACPGQGCKACAEADKYFRSGTDADIVEAKKLKKYLRVYFRCIDRNNEAAGPLKASISKKVYEAMVDLRNDSRRGGNFVDPEKGYDLCVKKTPANTKGNDTAFDSFTVIKDRVCRLGTDEQQEEWCFTAPTVKSLGNHKSLAEIEAMVSGAPIRAQLQPRRGSIQDSVDNQEDAQDFLS